MTRAIRLFLRFWFAIALSAWTLDSTLAQNAGDISREITAQVSLRGQTIVFEGSIDKASVDRLAQLLSASTSRISELAINSPGGNADQGLRLAGIVRDRHLSLIVEGLCGSACAVYVLPAAQEVRFSPHALVIMHHIPSPAMLKFGLRLINAERAPDAVKAKVYTSTITRLMAAQSVFYPTIGISPDRMFSVMDTWVEVSTRLSRMHKAVDYSGVAFVPDKFYLRDCLGYHVPWQEFEVADSILLSRAYGKVQAFMIKGNLYFEGKKISDRDFSCTPQS